MALFNDEFVSALSVPQQAYSEASLRQIFDRLAHSSIMRLSEASMDKLFDLMVMGFKLQLASMLSPRGIVNITMQHLAHIRELVDDAKVLDLIDAFEERIRSLQRVKRKLL